MKGESKDWTDLYIRGFNRGYYMAEHSPEDAHRISQTIKGMETISPRAEGFLEGVNTYEKQQIQKMRPEWMQERTEERQSDMAAPERDVEPDR